MLRIAGPDDAIALMKLRQRLDEETSFMLLEPGERDTSIQALARHLEEVSRSENSVVIVAGRRGDMAGYVELAGGKFRRNRSTTHVIIGVLAEASGQGVGTGLLEEAKRWAAARGLRRIELNVMAHNHRAIALYERAGFVREGRRVDCLLIDGTFLDELSMAMILPGSLSRWRRPESNRVGNACKARPLPQLLIPVVPGRDGARPGLSVLHAVEMSSSVHVHPQVVPCNNCAW